MNDISDIENRIGNRKLKTDELEYLLKTVQRLKNKKVSRLETFKHHQRIRDFSKVKSQPPLVKKIYNPWNKSRLYEKYGYARSKERYQNRLKKHYQVLRHVKTSQLNPNGQTEVGVHPKLYENLKERDTFSENQVISTGSTGITLHVNYEKAEATTKQIRGALKNSFATSTEDDYYAAMFSNLRENKFHPTSSRMHSSASFILLVSTAVLLSLLLIFVLFRCARRKNTSQKTLNTKKRGKRENKNAKYILLEDKQHKYSVNSFDGELSNKRHDTDDVKSGLVAKNTKTNMDASRIVNPKEFLTPKLRLEDLDNLKKSAWFILNNNSDSFRLLSHSGNNPKDEYSLSTDEIVSSLDISLPSVQLENIQHSNNSNFLNGMSPILNTSDSDSDNSYSSAVDEFHSNSPKVADKEASCAKQKINFISAPKHIQR